MMRNDLTELVFILDRSGSMLNLTDDTIGGFNSTLAKQRKETGEALVTTVLFDDRVELLHDRLDVRGVSPLTRDDYFVRGSTALLDAIGQTVTRIARNHSRTAEEYRPGKTVFVIITDGYENASREYSFARVKSLIEHEKSKYGWEFLFLGANIDAAQTAERMGIDADHAADFHADSRGVGVSFSAAGEAISQVRNTCAPLGRSWKKTVDEDYCSR